jgi:D-sedoheptulose 7-phosphate isomerase
MVTTDDAVTRFRAEIEQSIAVKSAVLANVPLLKAVGDVINAVLTALNAGGKVFFAGNGGSAADAQHLAAEFVSRLNFDRPGLPAQSLATDTSIITAIGNDYGYERLFARQIQAYAREKDVFFGISTSGRSKNILEAFEECRARRLTSVALSGLGGELEGKVDHLIRIPSNVTARIQECHILIGHIICSEVERRLFAVRSA